MQITYTALPGVLLLEPRVFTDRRGFFLESYQVRRYADAGLPSEFVQFNHSRSFRKTLRGLHYQLPHAQGKLVYVIRGEIYDVAVDLRAGTETFGTWIGVSLSDVNHRQLYVPPGLAHGFCVLSDEADVMYGCTDYYHPDFEQTIRWNDPDLGIQWPIDKPVVSSKDRDGQWFSEAPCFPLSNE